MIKTAASLSYALYDWKTTLAYAFSLNKEDLIQLSYLQHKQRFRLYNVTGLIETIQISNCNACTK